MKRVTRRQFLLMTASLLGLVLAVQQQGWKRKLPSISTHAQQSFAPTVPDLTLVADVPGAEILRAKPLFHSQRRPFPSRPVGIPNTAAASVQIPPPAYVLRGTATIGTDRTAILEHRDTKANLRVREGALIAGWTIDTISRGHVILKEGARSIDMRLPSTKINGASGR